MCFATMALVAGVAGAATSAGGMIMGGEANKNAAIYQAAVAHNNEIIANQNAEYATQAGQAKAAAVSLKNAAVQGKLKTQQAASGVDVNKGSPVDVRVGQAEAGKLDTETELNNAMLTAYGYRVNASNFAAESTLDKVKASQAETGALIGATGSLLSNASAVGFKWSGFNPGGAAPINSPEARSEV